MPTPPEPSDADEPERDAAGPDGSTDHDAVWRAIVDNYGERAELEDTPPEVPGSPRALEPVEPVEVAGWRDHEVEEHFVPPPPPPLPRPTPARLIAWTGLFGVPALVLVFLVTHLALPSWAGLLLMAWFVGGFVFLVASMRPDEHDGYDDGAVL